VVRSIARVVQADPRTVARALRGQRIRGGTVGDRINQELVRRGLHAAPITGSRAVLRSIALDAQADERTVKKALHGEKLRPGFLADRIAAELERRGLSPNVGPR
jgi:SOS response regulatory protein OraA/RecX